MFVRANYVFVVSAILLFAAPAAQANKDPSESVKFGALLTLTGFGAFMAENCREGMELAKDDINREGGIASRPLSIIYEDFGSVDLARAASAAQKLINVDHVSALFPFWSEDTEVVAPIAERAKVPLIASFAGGIDIGKYGRHVFRTTTSDTVMVERLVRYAAERSKRNLCVIRSETAYFESFAAGIKAFAPQVNASVRDLSVPASLNDFRPVILGLGNRSCEVFIAVLNSNLYTPFVRALRQLKQNTLVIGPSYPDYVVIEQELGDAAGDFVYGRYVLADENFVSRYADRYQRAPQQGSGNCYDAIKVVGHVMNERGLDFDAVNKGLRELSGYEGVTGTIKFDASGNRFGEQVRFFHVSGRPLELDKER